MSDDERLIEESEPAPVSSCWRRRFALLAPLLLAPFAAVPLLARRQERAELTDIVELAPKGIYPLLRGGVAVYGEEDQDKAICVGNILSAGAWLSGGLLKVTGAVQDCDSSNFGGTAETSVSVNISAMPGLCARNIAGAIRDFSTTALLLEGAATACNKERIADIKCITAVTNSVRQAGHLARFSSELSIFCPENLDVTSLYLCINRVEGVGWSVDPLLGSIAASARLCGAEGKPPKEDVGACVGEILGAAAFVAAAALDIWRAADFECLSALDSAKVLTLNSKEKDRINARCAVFAGGAARTFGIAAAKASEASKHCALAKGASCSRAASFAAAALSGAAEGMAFMRLECGGPLKCCTQLPGNPPKFECDCTTQSILELKEENKVRSSRCARFTSGALKELAVTVSLLSETAGTCGPNTGSAACSHFLGGAVAGGFFLSEAISRASWQCKEIDDTGFRAFFRCGQATGFMGDSVDTMTAAIGGALRDCAFGDTKRKSNWLSYSRRFFLP
ncbi:unnamed protein product [Effrenium voratum]|uniref:Uncharacterized protein n=1 Tax=Effrenium voratum TaxID=2562239 RepID=A0AA36JCB6_9DINO|nr:unnamed protein product [Effrenium voratum]